MRSRVFVFLVLVAVVAVVAAPSVALADYTWNDMQGPAVPDSINSMAYDSTRNILYVGTDGSGTWRCTDPDSNPAWTDITGTGRSILRSLAYDSARNILYAGTDDDVWRLVNPHNTSNWINIDNFGAMGDTYIPSLAYDSGNNVLFAGSSGAAPALGGVWRLKDPHNNQNWQQDTTFAGWYVNALVFNNGRLYMGFPGHNGVRRCSSPNNPVLPLVWVNTDGNIKNETVVDLCFDSNGFLYAVSEDGSNRAVWRCDDPEGTPALTWTDTGR